jgi:hypothetical protein
LPSRRASTHHWKITTFTAGVRICECRWVIDGPMVGDAFRAYVTQVLVPELESATLLSRTTFRPIASVAWGKQRGRGCDAPLPPVLLAGF